jgi:Tfp pilus assembly protein FimT
VELAVVLVILAVILGLVLPEASSFFFRSDLKASSRRLAGAVAYARSQAMLEGRLWELTLDLDTDSFWAAAVEEGRQEANSGGRGSLHGCQEVARRK